MRISLISAFTATAVLASGLMSGTAFAHSAPLPADHQSVVQLMQKGSALTHTSQHTHGPASELAATVALGQYVPQSGAQPQLEHAQQWNTENGDTHYWIPLAGPQLAPQSGLAITNIDGHQSVTEMAFSAINAESGQVQVWRDGTIEIDRIVHASEVTPDQARLYGLNWGKLNDCLSRQGIAAWVIAGIALACSLPCATIVGCIPCIAAAVGIAGVAGYCVHEAWD